MGYRVGSSTSMGRLKVTIVELVPGGVESEMMVPLRNAGPEAVVDGLYRLAQWAEAILCGQEPEKENEETDATDNNGLRGGFLREHPGSHWGR